jgi:hypothetical protein
MSDLIPDDDPTHDPDRMKGEDYAEPASEHKGATNRPVGQVEGDLMEPNDSGSGTSDVT